MPDILPEWPAFAFLPESPWGKVFLAFLRQAYERSGSIHTLMHYTQILRDFFTNPPQRQPDEYDRDSVERFIHSPGRARGREGQPVAPGTINDRLSCLSSFYTYAAGYTMADAQNVIRPVLRTTPPTLGIKHIKRARAYRVLSVSEVERFFAVIPRDTEQGLKYVALFTCYLFSARRRAEILHLRWKDLEKATTTESNGRVRDMWTYCWYGKGKARILDHAEMPEPAISALLHYLDFSGRLAVMRPDHALFTADTTHIGRGGYDPTRPLSPQAILGAVKRYARAAGIDEKKATIHMWRHVSARTRYEEGEDIRSIQQLLRHSSLAATHDYIYTLVTVADKGAKLLEQRFGKL